jgi:hypothetical protein
MSIDFPMENMKTGESFANMNNAGDIKLPELERGE